MELSLLYANGDLPGLKRRQWIKACVFIAILILASCIYKYVIVPSPPVHPYQLIMTPAIFDSVAKLLSENWRLLLLPYEYEPGRFYWSTTVIYFTYTAEKYLGSVSSYIIFSSIFVIASFFSSFIVTRSLRFSSTLAFLFAFGTQLNYQFTYGNLIALYLVLTYIALNFSIASALVMGRVSGPWWRTLFVISLAVVALSNEMWINYATALIAAALFLVLWSSRHQIYSLRREVLFLLVAAVLVLVAYLAVRMRLVHQYLAPGAEEELIITYKHKVLVAEDFIANFFTYLHTVLTNYLPSVLTSSNSIVYLPPGTIVAEQHGYDQGLSHLVLMNHLFMWRFYAGIFAALFLGLVGIVLVRCWRHPVLWQAAFVALALMVLGGFSTHLSIKMRPYNTVPALPYKAIISITAFTVLIAFAAAKSSLWFRSLKGQYAFISLIWLSAFIAALTRPYMQSRLLAEVGLVGGGDPLGQILRWIQ